MEMIRQRNDYDCSVACMAMVTHNDYDSVLNRLDFDPAEEVDGMVNYMSFDEMAHTLIMMGNPCVRLVSKAVMIAFCGSGVEAARWQRSMLLSSKQLSRVVQLSTTPAILEVEGFSNNSTHAVAYDEYTATCFNPKDGTIKPIDTYTVYSAILLPYSVRMVSYYIRGVVDGF